jgi:hypothetical protein
MVGSRFPFVLSIAAMASAVGAAQQPRLGPAPVAPFQAGVAEQPLRTAASSLAGSWFDISTRSAVQGYFNTFLTLNNVPLSWNGDVGACNAGTTSQAYKNVVTQQINWFRAMAGVPAGIILDPTYSSNDQLMALMISANGQLSHSPPSSWTCYTSGGASAASNSNICLGLSLLQYPGCVEMYMEDDGSGNDAVGHRRWLLYPQTQSMGTGDVPGTGNYFSGTALWVIDSNYSAPRPPTRDSYVAWPPYGYIPYELVVGRWSFSYPAADFSQASIAMTMNGSTVPLTIDPVANGYGENAIVWEPQAIFQAGSPDSTVTISISNVKGSGIPANFTYQVIVFDPSSTVYPPFFGGATALGGGVYYLQFSDGNPFGYYNFPTGSVLYHYDMGFEAFVPGSASDLYLYDFTSGHWWYTSSTLFPYLYDFTLKAWIYYSPDAKNPGHYTANPRYFSNLATGKIITM